MAQKVLDALKAKFPSAIARTGSANGDEIAWVKRENLVEVARWLRDDPAMLFDYPVFSTAIDWLDWKPIGLPPDAAWDES
jgi:NADH-quinone oxidoreductase subunit C